HLVDEAVNEVDAEPKSSSVEDVLKEVMASIEKDDDPKCLEMMVYEDPIVADRSQSTPPIHDHFEQAVKSIPDGMA
ncbi:hypothetical protein Dimus_022927, partial [Dionaea muscipula]